MNNMKYQKDQMNARERFLFCQNFIQVSNFIELFKKPIKVCF